MTSNLQPLLVQQLRRSVRMSALALLLTSPGYARSAEDQSSVHAEASAPTWTNKLVFDLGINATKLGPSMAVLAGFQHGPVRVGALLDHGMTWYDWTHFYGAGLGPVLELPFQFRTSLIAGVGVQSFHFEDCEQACQAARLVESRLGFHGRAGIGRHFTFGESNRAILVVMAWFTANYSDRRQAATDTDDSNSPSFSGGFRPGGVVTAGVDFGL